MDKEKNSIERQKFQMTQKGLDTIGKNLEKIASKKEKDIQKVEIQGASIITIKGDKGDDGHTPTDTELLAIIKPLIPVLRQPEDGHTPTDEELLSLIKPLIPIVKDGETPSDDRLLSLIKPLIPEEVDTQKIVDEVKKLSIKELKDLIPESDTAEEIIKKLLSIKKAWLPAEAITGDLVQHITRVVKQFGGSSGGISESRVIEIIREQDITLDDKVKYDVNDPTAGYVADKFVAGTGITLSEGTGADENKLKIINDGVITESDPVWASEKGSYALKTDYLALDQTTPQQIIETLTAGENVTAGQICYLKSDGKYWKAQGNAEATTKGRIVMATASISANATGVFLIKGKYTTSSLTAGATYFISTSTAGAMTLTTPTTGNFIRVLGYAESTTVFNFDPSKDYGEVA